MDETVLSIKSNSEKETFAFGQKIGELVEPGELILLSGNLGVGKTIITQGICDGLNIEEDVTSPTYNLINEYEGDLTVYHMDLYRLENEEELYDLAFEEYLDSDGIVIIEWPDIAYDLIPPEFIYIKINSISEKKREIIMEAEGDKAVRLFERLEKYVSNGD